MRLVRYLSAKEPFWGIVRDHEVVPLESAGDGDEAVRQILTTGSSPATARSAAPKVRLEDIRFMPPLLRDAKVICIGLNYKSHVEETGRDVAQWPSFFLRPHDSLVGHGAPIFRPRASTHFDYEGELALVIGRTARHVAQDSAMTHVAGYTCLNDGSVRDFQKHSVAAGKNFWRSGSCGPWIVTADDVGDPQRLRLRTRLNGDTMQDASTSLLIHSLPKIVSYLSQVMELAPGDIVATGTPAGVGSRRTPPLWMKAGDRVEVEIEHVGVLGNPVQDE